MNPSSLCRSALAFAIAAALPALSFGAPGASSAYKTDAQSTHVEDATSQGISQVKCSVLHQNT